ncbi:MAG: tRNA (N6-threonylcarbamoyladenosine(37)-N6)-methyltransferase TrmO [Lentisphaeraceae bacterium]|nr:tRNA (N6-threonylcarbamoyladenosine(37)-N6)-methyltransferase TrmO [Lentisphaeraceae bacterium]
MNFQFSSIGQVKNNCQEFYQVPHQVGILPEMTSVIELTQGENFEMALKDLEGFEKIWVLFVFDRVNHWKPLVQPPRGEKKVGVFACRSPHRPNPIGISAVDLVKIEGRKVFIRNHDFLDGTPILDIKPYISEVDSYSVASGWLDEVPQIVPYDLKLKDSVKDKLQFLLSEELDLFKLVEVSLKVFPFPKSNNRIKKVSESEFIFAVKTWRIFYTIEGTSVVISDIASGYDELTLSGKKESKWDDVWLHQKFLEFIK